MRGGSEWSILVIVSHDIAEVGRKDHSQKLVRLHFESGETKQSREMIGKEIESLLKSTIVAFHSIGNLRLICSGSGVIVIARY